MSSVAAWCPSQSRCPFGVERGSLLGQRNVGCMSMALSDVKELHGNVAERRCQGHDVSFGETRGDD